MTTERLIQGLKTITFALVAYEDASKPLPEFEELYAMMDLRVTEGEFDDDAWAAYELLTAVRNAS